MKPPMSVRPAAVAGSFYPRTASELRATVRRLLGPAAGNGTGPKALVVQLTWGEKRGLFIPEMWHQVQDPKRFLWHLKRKAGLDPEGWRSGTRVHRFTAEAFSERGSVRREAFRAFRPCPGGLRQTPSPCGNIGEWSVPAVASMTDP
jgi:hypothetical protein